MRQIKFRGKRVDNGEWVYGDYFKTPLTDENSGLPPDSGWFFLTGKTNHCIGQDGVAFVVDPATVSQFTGLLDKNGKEIYESDWCTAMFTTREGIKAIQGYIFMDEYMWCIDCTGYDGDNIFSINRPHAFEIIGNLHDSPSLTNH